MSLDAALVYETGRGWYLAPSRDLEQLVVNQAPPRSLMEDPMTAAADLGICTWASCTQPATVRREQGWAFCTAHDVEDRELAAEEADVLDHRTDATVTPLPSAPSSIGRLLENASTHSQAKVRNLATRIESNVEQLRTLIREHEASEAVRKAEQQAKDEARAEIARLEQQIAAAKARLKGQGGGPPAAVKPKASRSSSWTPEMRAAAAERMRARHSAKAPADG
jgi:hypothetical protein